MHRDSARRAFGAPEYLPFRFRFCGQRHGRSLPGLQLRPSGGVFGWGLKLCLLFALGWNLQAPAQVPESVPAPDVSTIITNLLQLSADLSSTNAHIYRDLRLDVLVCAASRPQIGVFVVQDPSSFEVLELNARKDRIVPGDKIRIEGRRCLLRRRDFGIEISAAPAVDNDGLHERTTNGEVTLKAGLIPLRLDWFNCTRFSLLDIVCRKPNGQTQDISRAIFYRPDPASGTNLLPGLRAACYQAEGEGYWENVPNFRLLQPTKSGVTTNFDLQFKTREEMVGMRFSGLFNAPDDGTYHFQLHSDDGSLLFLGDPDVSVTQLGSSDLPSPTPGIIDKPMDNGEERPWMTVEGRVGFIAKLGEGLKFELRSERNSIWVKLGDASGLDSARLLNAYVRVTGVGSGILTTDGRRVLGQLVAASANELTVLEQSAGSSKLPPMLGTALQVQSLRLEDAKRGLPVRIRGVVTSISPPLQHWVSIQDDERGIFVDYESVSNVVPALGDLWEVAGRTATGEFAPMVLANEMRFLGPGRMPAPIRPKWNELNNGGMDAQWVEFGGLVTGVQTNMMTLLLPEGHLDVQMEVFYASDLKKFLNAVVRIRGTLYAAWDAATHEVQVGQVLMRNAAVNVDMPAPADPFDAPVKTPSELYLFDAQATTFQRVKIRGQAIRVEAKRIFLMDRGLGLQILEAKTNTATMLAGDLIEAVGYPDINGPTPLLREAIVRRIGLSVLPPPTPLTEDDLTRPGLDSTRVKVAGELLGSHFEPGAMVLEMQSGRHLYFARISSPGSGLLSLRTGSHLALSGVYVGEGDSQTKTGAESFYLLLNSPADVIVLSQPSWWTLQRLLIVVGVLLMVLVFSLLWITQLRRLVEHRTEQLQHETRERERIERQHAIEAERSRIARDLHDDMGSSLTEIGVLANTGQLAQRHNSYLPPLFETIANKAKNLIAALDVIVWAVDPAENSLQSLADYLSGYTGEYFAHTNIRCRFKVPVAFPSITLDGHVRHELFLSVKEALNNVVRHAGATEVEFQMAVVDNTLDIVIADNGKGFAPGTGPEGYGLENLSGRLKKLGGRCLVESFVGGGTTVKIHLPLPVGGRARAEVAQGSHTTND
jgi:signal transduction histidine kinase